MVNLVFWNYNYLHNNTSVFISSNLYDLSITLKDIIIKFHHHLTNNEFAVIKILKVYKNNPKVIFDSNNPYFDLHLSLYDYLNYYNIKSNNCDIIFTII
jgi:hypothetical protein